MPRIETLVDADSSDEEIITAIKTAGARRLYWRPDDWPEEGSNYPFSWVIPNDIGISNRRDRSFLKRLRNMAEAGLLEVRYTGRYRTINAPGFAPRYQHQRGMPRFRVVQT